jgi:flagellar motor switch protein FliG
MSKDETIKFNGAEIAARILEELPSEDRSRMVEQVRVLNPSAAVKIEQVILSHQAPTPAATRPAASIEQITELPDRDVQQLLREVPQHDLVISLKSASPEAREKILRNVSETKLRQIESDFKALPPMHPSLVEAAQGRVMRKAEEIYPEETPPEAPRRLRSRLA